jgi:hypothetical protein
MSGGFQFAGAVAALPQHSVGDVPLPVDLSHLQRNARIRGDDVVVPAMRVKNLQVEMTTTTATTAIINFLRLIHAFGKRGGLRSPVRRSLVPRLNARVNVRGSKNP